MNSELKRENERIIKENEDSRQALVPKNQSRYHEDLYDNDKMMTLENEMKNKKIRSKTVIKIFIYNLYFKTIKF